jgi:hypothetical protein
VLHQRPWPGTESFYGCGRSVSTGSHAVRLHATYNSATLRETSTSEASTRPKTLEITVLSGVESCDVRAVNMFCEM